mmetsp:Transcript_6303/g.15691  ORF Transcript_6303/g.15691 Transcript_6303/m.15691 type:complete len:231 (-) Transcript_6303:102-794(-)
MKAMASSILDMTSLASPSAYMPTSAMASTSSCPRSSSITTCTVPSVGGWGCGGRGGCGAKSASPATSPTVPPAVWSAVPVPFWCVLRRPCVVTAAAAAAAEGVVAADVLAAPSVKNSLTVTMLGWPDSCCIMMSSFVTSSIVIASSFRGSPSYSLSLSFSLSLSPSSDDESDSGSEPDASWSLPDSPPGFTRKDLTAYVTPVARCVAMRTTANPPVPTASPRSYSAANGR